MKKLLSSFRPFRSDLSRKLDPQPRSPWVVLFSAAALLSASAGLITSATRGGAIPTVQAYSKQTRAAGAAVFQEKGCEHCHGVDGIGTDRGPDLSTIGKRWKKDRIEVQIRDGGGGMPPFGDALQPDEVQLLVDYLSAKRKAPKRITPPMQSNAPSDASDVS